MPVANLLRNGDFAQGGGTGVPPDGWSAYKLCPDVDESPSDGSMVRSVRLNLDRRDASDLGGQETPPATAVTGLRQRLIFSPPIPSGSVVVLGGTARSLGAVPVPDSTCDPADLCVYADLHYADGSSEGVKRRGRGEFGVCAPFRGGDSREWCESHAEVRVRDDVVRATVYVLCRGVAGDTWVREAVLGVRVAGEPSGGSATGISSNISNSAGNDGSNGISGIDNIDGGHRGMGGGGRRVKRPMSARPVSARAASSSSPAGRMADGPDGQRPISAGRPPRSRSASRNRGEPTTPSNPVSRAHFGGYQSQHRGQHHDDYPEDDEGQPDEEEDELDVDLDDDMDDSPHEMDDITDAGLREIKRSEMPGRRDNAAAVASRLNALAHAACDRSLDPATVAKRVEDIVSLGGNLGARFRDRQGRTLLHLAASSRDPVLASALLENMSPVDVQDDAGTLPIHHCAAVGATEVATKILAHGPDGHAMAQAKVSDWTPLHYACHFGRPRFVAWLLQQGVHRGARDAAGRTAAQVAELNGKVRCATLIRDADDRVNALHSALRSGSDSQVESLLKRNMGLLNMSDASGRSCIHAAAAGDAFEAMRILLRMGADPDGAGGLRRRRSRNSGVRGAPTPLHIVSRRGKAGAARLLIEAGASLDALDDDGCTALHLAVQFKQTRVVEILVDSGCRLDIRDGSGQTPLHVCCAVGSEHIGRLLLIGGCDPHATLPAKSGKPPHEIALSRGHMALYRMLSDPRIDEDVAAVADGLGREQLSHAVTKKPREDRIMMQRDLEERISDATAMVAEMLMLGPGPPDRSQSPRSRSPRPRSPRVSTTLRPASPRRRGRAPR